MTSTASLSLQSFCVLTHELDLGQRLKNTPVNASEPLLEYQVLADPMHTGSPAPLSRRFNRVEAFSRVRSIKFIDGYKTAFQGEEMIKAVLVVHQSLVEMVPQELPVEIFVKEGIPFLRIKPLDIFQLHLVHELFCVAVLRNRRVYPIAIECSKPPILIFSSRDSQRLLCPPPFLMDRHCDQDVRQQTARTHGGIWRSLRVPTFAMLRRCES
jgi:hypothetical protein